MRLWPGSFKKKRRSPSPRSRNSSDFTPTRRSSAGDHVAFYVVKQFLPGQFTATAEIADARFFDREDLPGDTSEGTRRRIEEVFRGKAKTALW